MAASAEMIRVLIVDDQPVVIEAMRQMLADVPNLAYFACLDPQKAIAMANEIGPTVILQDLVMPEIDGLLLVKFFRVNPATANTPMIVLSSKEEALTKAEAFANGANDYMVKLPEKPELVARIQYHSRAYRNLIERNAAYEEIAKAKKHLADEFAAADRYVRSLLAKPWNDQQHPAIRSIDWRFVPTAQMGGDAMGYHKLDDEYLAFYVLDVTGHGLASALLGTTVLNVIRTGSLPNTDFKHPGQVLFGLNEAFPCEKHGEKFFTAWYGVYHTPSRKLVWSGAGHPSTLLYDGIASPKQLESQGPMIGMMPWPEFEVSECQVPEGARMFLYSDGAHEIHKTDGTDWEYTEFLDTMTQMVANNPTTVMDDLHRLIIQMNGSPVLDDDFSIVDVQFA
jgi:phosphoserine phosphatase RsbU/P